MTDTSAGAGPGDDGAEPPGAVAGDTAPSVPVACGTAPAAPAVDADAGAVAASGAATGSGAAPGSGATPDSAAPPGSGTEAARAALDELERRAADRRDRPAYGHDALISCDRLVRVFSADGVEVQALQGLDLLVREGELMALVGASGSGKSTLMNILAGLDTPTAGAAKVAGRDLLAMSSRERLRYRREVVGFVWQETRRNLLPYLTAAQNVALPAQLRGRGRARERAERVGALLEVVGVADCRDRRPHEMSGGQQQRVAIAVALANHPSVLLADEPTGELDSRTAEEVFAAFRRANAELGTTVVIVTHDQAVAREVRRTVAIRDGRTSTEILRRTEVDAATGREATVAREYAMLDRAGRLQLPAEYTEGLGMRDRVMLRREPDHIGVWPDDTAPPDA
ncbi:ABC transporter ATP-binding protein [Streptomyces fradiae]|uniref:ABC transporter ATP-binding protein n=1 Tax=Streptomyces fradiae TaxID=1906 RepID=UPI0039860A77